MLIENAQLVHPRSSRASVVDQNVMVTQAALGGGGIWLLLSNSQNVMLSAGWGSELVVG